MFYRTNTTLRNTVERTSINEYFELSSSIVSRYFYSFRNSSEKKSIAFFESTVHSVRKGLDKNTSKQLYIDSIYISFIILRISEIETQ